MASASKEAQEPHYSDTRLKNWDILPVKHPIFCFVKRKILTSIVKTGASAAPNSNFKTKNLHNVGTNTRQ
jgi:hypothetical protein